MKSACVGVLSIIELKNARWNTEKWLHVSDILCTLNTLGITNPNSGISQQRRKVRYRTIHQQKKTYILPNKGELEG